MDSSVQAMAGPRWRPAVGRTDWGPLVAHSFLPAEFDVRKRNFQGSLTSRSIGDLRLVSMQCEMHSARRSSAHIQAESAPELVLTFQKSGTFGIEQDGRMGTVQPGQFAVYSTARPLTITGSNDYRSLSLKFPLGRCPDVAHIAHEFTGIPFDGQRGWGPTVLGMMEGLDRSTGSGQTRSASRVAQKVVGLVEELLLDRFSFEITPVEPGTSQALLDQCLAYIEQHLQDPDLSPKLVADANFISTRYLHVLFEKTQTTVAAYIRQQRISRVCEDLSDIHHHRISIDSIARRWGFVNASHFGKVFKKTTGQTPLEFRLRCLQDVLN